MKIGILSLYYNGYNYGAQLQAYALCKAMSTYGDAEQICYMHQHTDLFYWFRGIPSAYKMDLFSKSIPHSDRIYDNYSIGETVDKYDVFVTGSDQVWGDKVHVPCENTPIFALKFVPDSKIKISYAASMGGKYVNDQYEKVLKGSLGKLDAISVREKSSVSYVENLSKSKVDCVCDPTFLLSREDWESILIKPDIDEPYDVVYLLGDEENIKYRYKSKNKIINLNPSEINAGPSEFLGYIKYAENVITDSYHAIVFSIIFERDFCPVSKDIDLDIRIIDLLESLNIDKKLAHSEEDISLSLSSKVNCYEVKEQIRRIRKDSIAFIEKNLSIKKDKGVVPENHCTGCGACADSCVNNCFSWCGGERGFYYPKIISRECISCNRCVESCPVHKKMKTTKCAGTKGEIPIVYSAINNNEDVLRRSSSGGVFYEFARLVLENGGVVYATAYGSEFEIECQRVERIEELDHCLTSKYAQSDFKGKYINIKQDLDSGKQVLVVGTPCQCAALSCFLNKNYENLLLIDFICHGVPSNGLWSKYVEYLKIYGNICRINMRNKTEDIYDEGGFYKPSMLVEYEKNVIVKQDASDNMYLSLFLDNVMLRESCYHCKFRGTDRKSDITIGDFHGKSKLYKIDKQKELGTSLVFVNTPKGSGAWGKINTKFAVEKEDFNEVIRFNVSYFENWNMQYYTYYIDCLFEQLQFDELFKLYKECIQRENERMYYWKLVTTEMCLKKLNKIINGGINKNNVIVYGLGEIGKTLCTKLKYKPLCIIDQFSSQKFYEQTPIFNPYDERLKKYLDGAEVVVTPCKDYQLIIDNMKKKYETINIISINDFILSEQL